MVTIKTAFFQKKTDTGFDFTVVYKYYLFGVIYFFTVKKKYPWDNIRPDPSF